MKYFSLKRLNYRNATDRVSVFRATGNSIPCQTAVKKIILFFPRDHYRVCFLKTHFLVQAEKHLTQHFVRCMSLWPQAHRFCSERYISVVTNFGRFWSGFVNETFLLRSGNVQDWFFLCSFLTETSERHKERLLALVTFFLFFQRVSALAETFFRDDYN